MAITDIIQRAESTIIRDKLNEAKAIYAQIVGQEASLFRTRDQMLAHAWKLGRILQDLKEEIGHGKWLFWLGGNWPDLGERNAQRCMAFFKANEHWSYNKSDKFIGFELDSVRKFFYYYIPPKERLELEGDKPISPGPHHLTFINQFSKYDRQLRSGQVESFSLETFREEIAPMIRRLADICGRDWLALLLRE
jgi:Protein of unknown function (DUF3102)